MKPIEAKRLYNKAERAINEINSNRCFIDRAIKIDEYLTKMYGDEVADEIIELVFIDEIN